MTPDPLTRAAFLDVRHEDLRTAVRLVSGKTIQELADAMHIDRKQLDDCLSGKKRGLAVRRALEVELGVPQHALDRIMEDSDGQQP